MANVITSTDFETLTPRQLAIRLHVSYRVVLRGIRTGEIPSTRFGPRSRVAVAAVEKMLAMGAGSPAL